MTPVRDATPPDGTLIAPFARRDGYYVDGFCVDLASAVSLEAFITAFYTTSLFRAERVVLRLAARAPSTDADVAALAQGRAEQFAAWTVEARTQDEIVLGDASGRTKSWLRVAPHPGGTQLWFGSVVVPVEQRGRLTLGPVFHALLGAHKVYSRLLLGAAAARLR